MYPVLTFALDGVGFAVTAYRLFFALAVVATLGLSLAIAARRGLPARRVALVLLAAALAVPLGARALDVLTKPAAWSGESALSLSLDGFSLFGGLALATGVGWLACHRARLDPWRLADAAAPGLGVGIALIRLGCFGAGCCFGRETDLPWGVVFPPGSEAHLHQALANGGLSAFAALGGARPVHPTKLYEALAALLAGALTLAIQRCVISERPAATGVAVLGAALLYDAFRLANHFLREPSGTLGVPDAFYPAVYASVLALGLIATIARLAGEPAATAGPADVARTGRR
jgi:phosphatidylglycerol---prolipoprotein diacylglyceryl transferase